MPHCIVEYSNDISVKAEKLIDAVYKGALRSELFEESHIKTRAIGYKTYQVGANKESFIHVNARILSGRSIGQRSQLSELILDELSKLAVKDVVITVDVIDMERACYRKIE